MAINNGKIYDVAIVGAGPAGSSAAIRLASGGLKVLLVERKEFPREKLCGAFISPECLEHFHELGVLNDISSAGGTWLQETVFYSSRGRGVSVPAKWFGSSRTQALSLSRSEMDQTLLRGARQKGAEVLTGANVVGNLTDGESVCGLKVRNPNGSILEIEAKLVIDASGRMRTLGRQYEPNPKGNKANFVAFKTNLKNVRISPNACEIYAYKGGYGGCSQVENQIFNLCFIASAEATKHAASDPERVFREVVLKNKRASLVLGNAEVISKWVAVPIESYGRNSLVPATGLLTIGDAAAFIDPFTGSGILLALESAKLVSEAVLFAGTTDLDFDVIAEIYERSYQQVFDKRLRVCSLLRHAAFVPFLADATISAVGLSKTLRRFLARRTRFGSARIIESAGK